MQKCVYVACGRKMCAVWDSLWDSASIGSRFALRRRESREIGDNRRVYKEPGEQTNLSLLLVAEKAEHFSSSLFLLCFLYCMHLDLSGVWTLMMSTVLHCSFSAEGSSRKD